MTSVTQRFLKYIALQSTSDEEVQTCPSTEGQLALAKLLAEECKAMGLSDISIDSNGYLFATLPSNTEKSTPVIGFIAHMDTSPDAPGENIRPNIIEHYDGNDIPLKGITLSPKEFPSLLQYQGKTLITTDGTTLLGADDKAGIAEILTAMEHLIAHPEISHGVIKIAFTPDEEIGRGAKLFDVKKFAADFAYTVDGGRLGELEYENFNAARAKIEIQGKSVHPGTAKNAMVNALLIAVEIAAYLPANETPEHTEQYEGFFHLHKLSGTVSHASLSYLIRDFDKESFEKRKLLLKDIVALKNSQHGKCIEIEISNEYSNMYSQLKDHIEIIDLAKTAMVKQGVTPIIKAIRGGTDGATLSYMGLPCPNLFAGGHNFHGPYEYIPVSSMEKATQVIVAIATLAVNGR